MNKKVKLATCKLFNIDDLNIISVSLIPFDKADFVLVSKDGKTWIKHDAEIFKKAVEEQTPLQVS